MKWNDLNTQEKYRMYKAYRENNPDMSYTEIKSDFDNWYQQISKQKGINPNPDDPEQHYDYRRYYQENPQEAREMLAGDQNAHFPDAYKLPGHPTFSEESIYSNEKTPGGKWKQDSDGNWYFEHSDYTSNYIDRTSDYLQGTDEYSVYENGRVLPTVDVISNRKKQHKK